MSIPRYRIRTTILIAGIAFWLLVAYIHSRIIINFVIFMAVALLFGFSINTSVEDNPIALQVILFIVLLAAAPFGLIGVHFAPIWKEPRP
ncbi:MAG: hypothetical protein P4L84_04090 [Isosphaeraceae bacterium]|nr:hypothetical protein [Isosphaeraceae bacterium]